MRRPVIIAAFIFFLALAVSAQRGAMGASGGRGSVAHSSFGGMHAGPSQGFSSHGSHFGHGNSFGGVRFSSGSFHHCAGCRGRRGFSRFAGYGYPGYYSPYWWWDSSSSYDFDEEQEREAALASEMNAVSIQEQNLRERENWEREQNSYAQRRQALQEENTAPGPATVLVFRDHHQQEVRNYAIAGGTLWVLNEQAAKRIPLADLDLTATARMNDDRGVDFQVPK